MKRVLAGRNPEQPSRNGALRAAPDRTPAAGRGVRATAGRPTPLRVTRHLPERTLGGCTRASAGALPRTSSRLEAEDRPLPEYVREEFETYLRCGALQHGFLRAGCEHCLRQRLVAYSCKKRGLCLSCGARRMAESARHLVDEAVARPVRQRASASRTRCASCSPASLRRSARCWASCIVIAGWLARSGRRAADTAKCRRE